MHKSILALAIAAVVVGCSPAPEQKNTSVSDSAQATAVTALSESERLNQWFDAKYEEQLQQSPLQMTFLGRKDKYDQVDDTSVEAEDKQLAWLGASVEELKSNFDYAKLEPEAKTSYDVWVYQYEQAKEGVAFRNNGYVFTQMQGIHAMLPQIMINFHKVDTAEDMQAYVKRIEGISRALVQLLQRAKSNSEHDVRPPRFAYDGVLTQINNLINGAPFTDAEQDIPLWSDAKGKIDALVKADKLTDEQAKQLTEDSKLALQNHFLPAYNALKQWLEQDAIGAPRQVHWSFSRTPSAVDLAGHYNWRTDPSKAGGGYFIDLASHGLDLLLYLLGDVVDVRGISLNQQKLYAAEDAVSAVWQFQSGCLGSGFWNFAAAERQDKVVIYGSKGRIEFSVFENQPVQLFTEQLTEQQQLSLEIPHPENIQFYHIQAMVQDLLHGTGHPSTGKTALKASWMMEQILSQNY